MQISLKPIVLNFKDRPFVVCFPNKAVHCAGLAFIGIGLDDTRDGLPGRY